MKQPAGDTIVISPQTKWNRANAEKLRAHAAVRLALRHGTLKRGRCVDCGSLRTEAHHHLGYAPEHHLSIIWVCRKHHSARHAAERRASKASEAAND